jgi:hypothetical protein
MAIVFTEGFDMYNGNQAFIGLQSRWIRFIAGGGSSDGMTTGRFNGQAYYMGGDAGSNIRTILPSSSMSFGHGFAYRELDAVNNRSGLMNLVNGSLGGVVSLNVNALFGSATVSGPGGIIGSASGLPLTGLGVWHYWEVYGTVSATTGTCVVYLDGAQVIGVTNVNTGSSAVGGLQYTTSNLGGGGGNRVIIDDIFQSDSATRLGECKIETLRATGDSSVNWTPNSGSNNYSRVSETLVDGDTSYVSTASTGVRDLYTIGSLSSTPANIFAVNVVAFAEKTDATTRQLYNSVRSATADSDGIAQNLAASYGRYDRIMNTDPATSAAWTASGVNNLLIGPKAA